jgi:alpha/beta hydrolase family protein/alcohol dehydrogenase-like protein
VRTEAAVLWEYGQDWQVTELDLDEPRQGEVLVRLAASGLCHFDEHVRLGDLPLEGLPCVGGHEGAGVVERTGPGVTKVSEGDHVVLNFIPACGDCAWCASGHQNLCDQGADLRVGLQRDGTSRHHVAGHDARLMCLLGTFAPYTVCRVTDASFDTDSYQQFAEGYFLRRDAMQWFWHQYTTDPAQRAEITASPLRASRDELAGLPPALVITGEADVLRDEGEAYASKLRAAGVPVTAVRYQGIIHDFVMLNALRGTQAASAAIAQATATLTAALHSTV